VGTSTSHSPMGLHGQLQGQLYFLPLRILAERAAILTEVSVVFLSAGRCRDNTLTGSLPFPMGLHGQVQGQLYFFAPSNLG
jgi:hypothetical protein